MVNSPIKFRITRYTNTPGGLNLMTCSSVPPVLTRNKYMTLTKAEKVVLAVLVVLAGLVAATAVLVLVTILCAA